MSKKLAIQGHSTRGKEVIELLKMMGGTNPFSNNGELLGNKENCYYYISKNAPSKYISWNYIGPEEIDKYEIFTLEEFLKKYPFKVGDKVFLYDNITEGCVTEMKWDEDKGTVKYCVYTSAEYWCDVKELLKWNAEFLVNKEKGEEVGKMLVDITLSHLHRNHLEDVLSELYEHIKTTPKEELEREFEEIKEWSNVGPTVEEFMAFCECVNKKPKYPDNYDECCNVLRLGICNQYTEGYKHELIASLHKLYVCRDAYWKIVGEQIGLDKPWEPDWSNDDETKFCIYTTQNIISLDIFGADNRILAFPTEEMRDAFYENFKDLIEKCKKLL